MAGSGLLLVVRSFPMRSGLREVVEALGTGLREVVESLTVWAGLRELARALTVTEGLREVAGSVAMLPGLHLGILAIMTGLRELAAPSLLMLRCISVMGWWTLVGLWAMTQPRICLPHLPQATSLRLGRRAVMRPSYWSERIPLVSLLLHLPCRLRRSRGGWPLTLGVVCRAAHYGRRVTTALTLCWVIRLALVLLLLLPLKEVRIRRRMRMISV